MEFLILEWTQMRLERNHKIIISLLVVILGWFFLGIGYTTKIGITLQLLLIGLIMIFLGLLFFILAVNSKRKK